MERVQIIHCTRVLVSALRGRFDYVTLRFCWLLLSFVGDCAMTLSAVVAMLVHPLSTVYVGCKLFIKVSLKISAHYNLECFIK